MNPLIQLKTAPPLLIIFTLLCFTLLPQVQATPDPGSVDPFNTADGDHALFSNTTGLANVAFGWYALFANTEGSNNTAVGTAALDLNTGNNNTAVGTAALLLNTGGDNTAVGVAALETNSTGSSNTANGAFALFSNTTGVTNTGNGYQALLSNTTGNQNTAIGTGALFSNTSGNGNTATGLGALAANTIGQSNTANGVNALGANIDGSGNTAFGYGALDFSTTGHGNTALGDGAGSNVTTASNAICVGSSGANVSNSCFIGNIRGTTTQNNDAIAVLIDSAGQLGTVSSSRRYKTDIEPMDKASESILALKPVRFRYKVHKDATPQFGLIAEQVAEVNPDLVVRDKNGEIYTVRYDAVNAMLLNEFLKEHRTVQELMSIVAKQEAANSQRQKQIEALTAGLQKVSALVETSRTAPQMVNNP